MNETRFCVVFRNPKRSAELPSGLVMLNSVTLGNVCCQDKLTPVSFEEQRSHNQEPPFTDAQVTVSMIGLTRRSAEGLN